MLRTTILYLVLVAIAAIAAPVPKEVKRGVALEGSWEVVELHMQGQAIDTYNGAVWNITKELIKIDHPDSTGMPALSNKIISVEITATSKNLDYTNSQGIVRKCIFEIDGDSITLCIPLTTDRPEELKAGQNNLLYKFKRVKE